MDIDSWLRNDNPIEPDYSGEDGLVRYLMQNRNSSLDCVKEFVNNGIDVKYSLGSGKTALHFADDENVIRFLVNSGIDINVETDSGLTPLHYAILGKSGAKTVSTLIELGADVNALTVGYDTPLSFVLKRDCYDSEVVNILLENGALPVRKDEYEKTRRVYSEEQKRCFDIALNLSGNDKEFRSLCKQEQERINSSVHLTISDIELE